MNVDTAAVLQGHTGGKGQLDKLFHIPLDLYLPSGPATFSLEKLFKWLLKDGASPLTFFCVSFCIKEHTWVCVNVCAAGY